MARRLLWLFYVFFAINGAVSLVCYCYKNRCNGADQVDCNGGDVCFARLFDDYTYVYGCYTVPDIMNPNYSLEKCFNPGWVLDFQSTLCCNDTNLCNQHLNPPLPLMAITSTASATPENETMTPVAESTTSAFKGGSMAPLFLGLIIAIPIFCIIIIILIIVSSSICILRHRKNRLELNRRDDSPFEVDTDATVDIVEMTCTSGSGSGLPFLVQRTVARSIKLGEPIGSGRFGQVYIGEYLGEKVAVKKFASRDEQSWFRETEIYNTVLLRHENILGFFASDMVSNNGATELWLITQYHPNGSLYDYLNQESVQQRIVLRMIVSICNGLSHLHTEIYGTMAKPAIAHRDMKSKNILVRNDLQCCIADFGLAVMKDSRSESKINMPTNPKQGTKRYMAPEILNETMNMGHFDSFKQADIYSLGLVMWEICRKCSDKNGTSLEYEPPFHGLVPPDPSFEDMRNVVVVEKRQPTIPNNWHQHELLRELTKLMRECWYFTNSARPTALYLKKKISKFSQDIKIDRDEHE